MAQRRGLAHGSHRFHQHALPGVQRFSGGHQAVVDALRRVSFRSTHKILVHHLCHKRQHRREQLGKRRQHGVERLVSGLFVGVGANACAARGPEAAAAAANVPVAQVVQKRLGRLRHFERDVCFVALGHCSNRLAQAGDDPLVQHGRRSSLRPRRPEIWLPFFEFERILQQFGGRRPLVDARIGNEEGVGVPQRDDEATTCFIGAVVAEEQVLVEWLVHEEPAHRVHAHSFGGVIEPDRIAPRFVHRTPIFRKASGIAMNHLRRRHLLENGAHRDETVEPVAELPRERFADPFGRHPLGPILAVGAILRSRIRHAAGVEPRIAHIGDARHHAAALGTDDLDRIHIRTVRRVPLEDVPPFDGARAQFVLVAEHLEVITVLVIAHPDRQRQTPVALLGDHPIVHVAQPVHLAGVAEFGDPLNLIHHIHDLVAQTARFLFRRDLLAGLIVQFAHIDEPFIHQTEDQRRVAAPADGITVRVTVHAIEPVLARQIVENLVRHCVNVAAGKPAEAFQEHAVFGQRGERGQTVGFA